MPLTVAPLRPLFSPLRPARDGKTDADRAASGEATAQRGLLDRITARLPAGLSGWTGASPVIRFAELHERDAGQVIVHFMMLGRQDREQRFHNNQGFAALSDRYHSIDWQSVRFLGAWAGHRLVGVAELAQSRIEGAPCHELAVSVRGPWQGRGIATRLLRDALEISHREGLPVLMMTQMHNKPMINICRKLGGSGRMLDGEYFFRFPVKPKVAKTNGQASLPAR